MGFLDRVRKFVDRVTGRSPKPSEPAIDSGIESAWAQPEKTPSLIDRIREGARNLFRRQEPTPEQPAKPAAPMKPEPFKPSRTPAHFRPEAEDPDARRYEIFKFRRATSEDENTFYRLTQSIWDVPGVPADKRDEAIFDYFKRKYGMSDPNEIYDFVLERNKEAVERYRNSPNAMKYEVVKSINIKEAVL